jgi:hypothetical protein
LDASFDSITLKSIQALTDSVNKLRVYTASNLLCLHDIILACTGTINNFKGSITTANILALIITISPKVPPLHQEVSDNTEEIGFNGSIPVSVQLVTHGVESTGRLPSTPESTSSSKEIEYDKFAHVKARRFQKWKTDLWECCSQSKSRLR